jgi:hypothetical protein
MKMQSIIIATVTLFFMSCYSLNKIKRISFKFYEGSSMRNAKLKIPKWISIKKLKADAENGTENQYWYADSSVFYITNKNGTLNYSLIRKQDGSYSKQFMSDSVSLAGVDEKGYCWREIKYRGLFYGYTNVPLTRKIFFDDALGSIDIK